jgi:hypothetical protein
MALPIVRVSRGRFDWSRYEEISQRLADARLTLFPAIQRLPGLLHYYVGIDAVTSTMVNVSIWDSLEHAQQMSTLAPMLALASAFQSLGVKFDPIANYATLWEVEAAS